MEQITELSFFKDLPEEIVEEFQNAMQAKLDQSRNELKVSLKEEIEQQLRKEYAAKYKVANEHYVDAAGKMIEESLTTALSDLQEKNKELELEKVKLNSTIRELQEEYKVNVKELHSQHDNHIKHIDNVVTEELRNHLSQLNSYSQEQLDEEIEKFNEAKIQYKEKVEELNEEYETLKQSLIEEYEFKGQQLEEDFANKIEEMNEYVNEQLTIELTTLVEQQKEIDSLKVSLIEEHEEQLQQLQETFIDEASELIDKELNKHLKKELREFKEDIEETKRILFGRKLFETFANEFKLSFFDENKEFRNLQEQLNEQNKMLVKAQEIINEQQQVIKLSDTKIALAEDKATRVVVLDRLLAPLDRAKRKTMESLLSTTKTQNLQEAFQKYLPKVIGESIGKEELTSKVVSVNGNKSSNMITENTSIANICRWAGM